MHWEKKICVRITVRRIIAAILAASTVVNLVIVGAVLGAEAAPAVSTMTAETSEPITPLWTATAFIPTSTYEERSTSAPTQTFEVTPTETFTPTQTPTNAPVGILCIKRFYWPTYRVQLGDTLFSIALFTDSTVNELMAANCRTNDRIYVGELLHVPRVLIPIITSTPTSTPTTTPTPTDTLTNTPTATDTPSPTPTSTATPTDTPTATPTSTQFLGANNCDAAELIADITEPPGTAIAPGTTFTKTWRLKNIGRCVWTTSYALINIDGELFGSRAVIGLPKDVSVDQTIDISIRMTAPDAAGFYRGHWMLVNTNRELFGIGPEGSNPLVVEINVIEQNIFKNSYVCISSSPLTNIYLAFSVTLSNANGVSSVTAFSGSLAGLPLQDIGQGVYSGSTFETGGYAPGSTISYYFVVSDNLGQSIRSPDYAAILATCLN